MPHTIHPRQKLIAKYRDQLTLELNNNQLFQKELRALNARHEENSSLSEPIKHIARSIINDSVLYIGREASQDECLQIESIIRTASTMLLDVFPFYLGFLEWHVKQNKNHLDSDNFRTIFAGRDSYLIYSIFLNSSKFHNYKNKTLYIPFNRGNIINLYSRCFDPVRCQQQKKHVVNYYLKNDLTDKQLSVVDFGFFGTLERTHQLVLYDAGVIDENILLNHSIIVKILRNPDDKSVFDKAITTKSFNENVIDYLLGIDRAYDKNVIGYLNVENLDNGRFIERNDNQQLIINDRPFIYFLQEINSGVVESRYASLYDGSQDYLSSTCVKFASLQQIALYQSILELIPNISNNTDFYEKKSLKTAYESYQSAMEYWSEFVTYEDRASSGLSMKYEPLLTEVNNKLLENGFQQLSIPYDA